MTELRKTVLTDLTDDADITPAGALKVDGSAVTQPVSGPLTDTELRATAVPVDGSGVTQPVSAAGLPLPAGAATSANQLPDGHNVTVDNAAAGAAVNVQDGGNVLSVDDGAGSLTVDAPVGTPVNVQVGDAVDTAAVVPNADDDTDLDGVNGLVTNSVLYGRIDADTIKPLRMDGATHSIQTMDYAHHEVHSGSAYVTDAVDSDLDTGDELIIAFTTPDTAKWAHMIVDVRSTSQGLVEVLEGPTITNGSGAQQAPVNRNRNSGNTSGLLSIQAVPVAGQVTVDPTITADGTVIHIEYVGVGKEKGATASRGVSEWILKQNTTYAIRITGEEDNGVADIQLDWYEHTDKD